MKSTDVLDKAKNLLSEDRAKTHGNKIINHENIARLWTAYFQNKYKLNFIILPEDVASLMTLLKLARTQAGNFNLDDYIDAAGYVAIAGEIAQGRHNQRISATLGEKNAKSDKTTKNK
jgi:hypothetical protein|tara:strand:+ start:796 stop:1149 length:354 start_codon:yes stop_codon:yes gene_type:complete